MIDFDATYVVSLLHTYVIDNTIAAVHHHFRDPSSHLGVVLCCFTVPDTVHPEAHGHSGKVIRT